MKNWEEEFDEKFQNKAIYRSGGGDGGSGVGSSLVRLRDCFLDKELKSFISSQIKLAEKRGYKRGTFDGSVIDKAEARGAKRILEKLKESNAKMMISDDGNIIGCKHIKIIEEELGKLNKLKGE